jgi:hypothetical protein
VEYLKSWRSTEKEIGRFKGQLKWNPREMKDAAADEFFKRIIISSKMKEKSEAGISRRK